MDNQDKLVIDGWLVDVESHRIARDGVERKLEPRGMELLVFLASRAGQVVSRADIEQHVWRDRVVGYEALSGSIAKIRRAFGDTNKQHRVIETIPKSGYRLIAPVLPPDPVRARAAENIAAKPVEVTKAKLIAGATLLVAMIVGLAWWQSWSAREQPDPIERTAFLLADKPSIAILPFTNMSGDPEQEYFADGMTDDLITDLSKIPDLFVISRNSTFTYKSKSVDVRQIARQLGVRYVMEGSVQRVGNQVRINAQLIDGATGGHLWAQRYDGYLDDIFSMRDKITRKIKTELSLTLVDREQAPHLVETAIPEAYDALLRGQTHYLLSTPADYARAIPFLERAVELDPSFARAHAVLAAVYWGICNNGWMESTGVSYADCSGRTSYHLGEALRNPTPLAHRIAARKYEYEQRWDEALLEAEKAIALNPNDPNGYVAISALQVNLGRAAEGLENVKMAMRFDPQSDYLWRLGYAQFHLKSYDEAAATMYRATRRNPDFDWNYLLLAAAYGHLGRADEARQAVATFNKLRFDTAGSKRPFTLADLEYWSIKDEAGLKRLREGLRKAGVPPG